MTWNAGERRFLFIFILFIYFVTPLESKGRKPADGKNYKKLQHRLFFFFPPPPEIYYYARFSGLFIWCLYFHFSLSLFPSPVLLYYRPEMIWPPRVAVDAAAAAVGLCIHLCGQHSLRSVALFLLLYPFTFRMDPQLFNGSPYNWLLINDRYVRFLRINDSTRLFSGWRGFQILDRRLWFSSKTLFRFVLAAIFFYCTLSLGSVLGPFIIHESHEWLWIWQSKVISNPPRHLLPFCVCPLVLSNRQGECQLFFYLFPFCPVYYFIFKHFFFHWPSRLACAGRAAVTIIPLTNSFRFFSERFQVGINRSNVRIFSHDFSFFFLSFFLLFPYLNEEILNRVRLVERTRVRKRKNPLTIEKRFGETWSSTLWCGLFSPVPECMPLKRTLLFSSNPKACKSKRDDEDIRKKTSKSDGKCVAVRFVRQQVPVVYASCISIQARPSLKWRTVCIDKTFVELWRGRTANMYPISQWIDWLCSNETWFKASI